MSQSAPVEPAAVSPRTPEHLRRANQRLLVLLLAFAAGTVLFVIFVFPFFYSLWCQVTGTGMRPNNQALAAVPVLATDRRIKVRVESMVFDGLPVEFIATPTADTIAVGAEGHLTYTVRNRSDRTIHLRPVHQVSPINATKHFTMRICFCFKEQELAPHETKTFPVVYRFTADLDKRINDVTLCYSLFDSTGGVVSDQQRRIEAENKRAILQDEP
jgi:cytochrome c oxidase assembly protein subunit 11